MGLDTWIRRGHPVLFAFIALLAAVDGAIATWLIVQFNKHNNAQTSAIKVRTGFLCFTSWWTVLLSVIYVGFFRLASDGLAASVLSHVVFLFVTFIFWTAGAASITASLGGGLNCSKIEVNFVYCNQLNALMGFAWVVWILVAFALVSSLLLAIRSRRRGEGMKGGLIAY